LSSFLALPDFPQTDTESEEEKDNTVSDVTKKLDNVTKELHNATI
jgi:hypothetical protein